MGKRNSQPLSFNTVKHSNRKERAMRIQRERMTLLSICAVIIALLLALAVFIFCSLADELNDREPQGTETETDPPAVEPSGSDVIYTPATLMTGNVSVGELAVINKDHPYDTADITKVLTNLVSIYEKRTQIDGRNPYQVSYNTLKMNKTAFEALNQMLSQYFTLSEDNSLLITSAFRTYDEQAELNSSIAAGASDHHTGYSVRLRQYINADTRADLESDHWIYENCNKYGFIVRYPVGKEAETGVSDYSDCFRYVGVAHATYIGANGLSLEEYIDLLKTDYAGDTHLKITGADGKHYEVYYVPASQDELTTYQKPQNYVSTVSGDNIGGFIVTVHLDEPVTA